jgi:hypothetical protein
VGELEFVEDDVPDIDGLEDGVTIDVAGDEETGEDDIGGGVL